MSGIESRPSRPLDPEKPYYHWDEYQGRLFIESECCGDSFSDAEERVLLAHLLAKHAVVSTVEELLALPPLSVVLTAAGTSACRFNVELFTIFGDERPKAAWGDLALPARVLFDPTEVVR